MIVGTASRVLLILVALAALVFLPVCLSVEAQRQQDNYKADESVSIIVRVPPVTPAVSALDPAALEMELWSSVKLSTDPDDFKVYLEKYPNGTFAGLARNRIRQLEASAKPAPSPVNLNAPDTSAAPKTTMNTANTKANPTTGVGPLPLRGFELDVVTVNSRGSETSRSKQQAQYWSEDIAGISLELVPVPGGTFLMGSPSSERNRSDDEGPQHRVTIGAFNMGKYEVTQAQWRAVAGLPKVARDLKFDPSKYKGDNLPVEQISWDEVVEFCARLSRATGRRYRLPTEAEWEYACRAGTTTAFAFGETVTPRLVNYKRGTYPMKPTPVGFMGVANAFGLYDMHGNVWEWCLDYWHENYNDAPAHGRAWKTAGDKRFRVLRGGAWNRDANICRSANRQKGFPSYLYTVAGFRVVVAARTP